MGKKKTKTVKKLHKIIDIQCMQFPNFKAQNDLRWVDLSLKSIGLYVI